MLGVFGFEDGHTGSIAEAFNDAVAIRPTSFYQPSEYDLTAAFGFADSMRADDGQHPRSAVPIAIRRTDLERYRRRGPLSPTYRHAVRRDLPNFEPQYRHDHIRTDVTTWIPDLVKQLLLDGGLGHAPASVGGFGNDTRPV